MELMARILRFLFWVLVISWSISLLKRLFRIESNEKGPEMGAESISEAPGRKRLIRDPVCGMHVAEDLAIACRTGNELVHFCSAECRDKYLSQNQRLAANG